MAKIKISDLPLDSQSYLHELTDAEADSTHGGFLVALALAYAVATVGGSIYCALC